MKQFFTFFGIFTATIGFNQLTNNMPTVGQVSIGTTTPTAGKQLTVSGEAKFLNSIEIGGNTTLNGNLILNRISNIGEADLSTTQLLLKTPTGDVKTVSISGIIREFYNAETHELALCEEELLAHPQWYNGLKKIYSPCDEVKVGVGTSNPTHKITVIGTSFSKQVLIGNKNASDSALVNGFATNHSQKLIRLGKKIGEDEQLLFSIANDGATRITNIGNNPSLIIDNGSNHAIVVKNSDGYKTFQVENNGLLRARRIKINSVSWADYVFNENYNLLSLEEIKQYIEENNHLPNVPSSDEIKKNGIDVSAMQQLQMEKIEELTLHLIELNESVKHLRIENQTLKEELKVVKEKK